MKKTLSFLVTLLIVTALSAQMDPIWESKADSRVIWKEFAPNGSLICGTKNDKTVAINAQTGERIWERDFDYGKFTILQNTTYIYWQDANIGLQIYDPMDGRLLLDSKDKGIENIGGFYPIREGNGLLLYTQMDDKEQFWMISFASGELLWKKELDYAIKKKVGGISFELDDAEEEGINCAPIGDGEGGVFVAVHKRILHIDKSGETTWDIEYPSAFGDQEGFFKATSAVEYYNIFPDRTGKSLYVFSGGYMTSHSRENGELDWAKPVKVSGPVKNIIFEENGMILIPSANTASTKTKINYVDYETGTPAWGEGLRIKGSFIQSNFCSKGIAFITKSFMNEAHFFNIIDPKTGTFELEKSKKIFPGPFEIAEVNGGLLISSSKGANLYNYETKEMVMNKELKVGGTDFLLRKDKGDKAYFFTSSKSAIYTLNKETLKAEQFNKEKIKFSGGDEAKGINVFEDGLVLYSEQNIIKFDYDGNVIFKNYYPAPGASGWKIAGGVFNATMKVMGGLATMAAAGATYAAVDQMDNASREGLHALDDGYGDLKGTEDYDAAKHAKYKKDVAEYEANMDAAKDELNTEMSEMAAMGLVNALSVADDIKAIGQRFKNSKATKNYIILMTKNKERGTGLAVISKLDGEIKGFIPMKQSKENPCYIVDPFTNHLFWFPSLDNGKNNFGRYNNIQEMMNKGTVFAYDLNKL